MKVSICGMGVMGKNHARVARKLGFHILSSYDPLDGDCYGEFLSSLVDADSLIICNPTKFHLKTIVDAKKYNKNIKILCEKPVSETSKDPLLEEVRKYQETILIGQVERFNPVVIELNNNIKNNKLNIVQIKTRRVGNVPSREKIDCKKDIGIHDLDFCCYLADESPEDIRVLSNEDFSHENMSYKIRNIQVNNEISWLYPYKDRTFEVLTDEGIFCGHFYRQELSFTDWSNQVSKIEVNKVEPLTNEQKYLHKMVKNNALPIVTVDENIKLLKLMGY